MTLPMTINDPQPSIFVNHWSSFLSLKWVRLCMPNLLHRLNVASTSVCMIKHSVGIHSLSFLIISTTFILLLLRPFNGLFSRTTWVNRQQKGKPFWILLEQEMTGWQWHQLDHMQSNCTLLQTTPVRHHSDFYRPDALPAAQPTASKH